MKAKWYLMVYALMRTYADQFFGFVLLLLPSGHKCILQLACVECPGDKWWASPFSCAPAEHSARWVSFPLVLQWGWRREEPRGAQVCVLLQCCFKSLRLACNTKNLISFLHCRVAPISSQGSCFTGNLLHWDRYSCVDQFNTLWTFVMKT